MWYHCSFEVAEVWAESPDVGSDCCVYNWKINLIKHLVSVARPLEPDELRFLRREGLLLKQLSMGRLVGVSEQTVARYEKGKCDVPKSYDLLLRRMTCETHLIFSRISLQRLSDRYDKHQPRKPVYLKLEITNEDVPSYG